MLRITLSATTLTVDKKKIDGLLSFFTEKRLQLMVLFLASFMSAFFWVYFSSKGLHLTYNDAMSHLDIARRVVDNLNPGVAQIGTVWLPLIHLLMLPTIWNDWMWQTGLSAGIISMISYVLTVFYTYKTVRILGCGKIPALIAVFVVATNTNFLYIQTTALTEALLMMTYSVGAYYLLLWTKTKNTFHLVISAFFVMLSTLSRYDGWIFFLMAFGAIGLATLIKEGWRKTEGLLVLFGTLGSVGIILWLGWNLIIFGDPFYFAFSEYSAKTQQDRMLAEGLLQTFNNLPFSLKTYYYSMIDNIGIYTVIFAAIGLVIFMKNNKNFYTKIAGIIFLAPLIANVVALYMGHSVIFLPETTGNSFFNVRYGLTILPLAAVLVGYLIETRNILLKSTVIIILFLQTGIFFSSRYAISLVDGLVGASQKNVTGIGDFLNKTAGGYEELILVSVASHDAILFRSGLPLKRYIHEGVGNLWKSSLENPSAHARYIIMRTHSDEDIVSREMKDIKNFDNQYKLVFDGDFADVYERTSSLSQKTDE